jgi:very-short-patch-repair endonuclease
MSVVTKQKLSRRRIEYLASNPSRPAWKTHEKFKSIPCEKWKNYLKSQGIKFVEEFQPLRDLGRFFSIDIAFPDKKIGIEINGGQHYDTHGALKPYYQSRHDLIEGTGWTIYEIPYHIAFDEKLRAETTAAILGAPQKVVFDFTPKPPKAKPVPKIVFRHSYPSLSAIKNYLAEGHSSLQASCFFGIKYKSFHAFLRKYGISTRTPRKLTPSEIDPDWRHQPNLLLRTKARPSKECLTQLIADKPLEQIGRMFDTTGNNIRKWCKSEDITIPKRGRGFWKASC